MMRRAMIRRIGSVVALVSIGVLGVNAAPAVARQQTPVRHDRLERIQVGKDAWQLFQATNASRGRFGIGHLSLNREMSRVARRHSAAMARAGSLFHTTDVDVYLHGTDWHIWGENVGYTPTDVASVQRAFMNSPPHRENILNRSFAHVAVGAVRVDGTLWVTVFFYA